jgi:hypothetical protein
VETWCPASNEPCRHRCGMKRFWAESHSVRIGPVWFSPGSGSTERGSDESAARDKAESSRPADLSGSNCHEVDPRATPVQAAVRSVPPAKLRFRSSRKEQTEIGRNGSRSITPKRSPRPCWRIVVGITSRPTSPMIHHVLIIFRLNKSYET